MFSGNWSVCCYKTYEVKVRMDIRQIRQKLWRWNFKSWYLEVLPATHPAGAAHRPSSERSSSLDGDPELGRVTWQSPRLSLASAHEHPPGAALSAAKGAEPLWLYSWWCYIPVSIPLNLPEHVYRLGSHNQNWQSESSGHLAKLYANKNMALTPS